MDLECDIAVSLDKEVSIISLSINLKACIFLVLPFSDLIMISSKDLDVLLNIEKEHRERRAR